MTEPGSTRLVPRPTPFDAIRARLAPVLGEAAAGLPRGWERLGDVLVLRGVTAAFGDRAADVAHVYADVVGARVVLEEDGVAGEFRTPRMSRLCGTGPAMADLRQDGIRYRFDAQQVMFSSGNLPERERMGRVDATGETVVDLFAGIGYFTLPLLVHGGAARVIACEKNPVAASYLRENAESNGVAARLEIREGDCRAVAPRGVADRVLLGYFPHGHRFLRAALAALRREGGILHYHDTARAHRPDEELRAHLETAAQAAEVSVREAHVRIVKSFAPGVVHAVLDARIGPEAGADMVATRTRVEDPAALRAEAEAA